MGTLRRSTVELLEADQTLETSLLLRMQGVMDPEERLVKPWEVCKQMGLSYGGYLAWVNADESGVRMERFRRAMEVRAAMLAEDALTIADDAAPDEVAKANLRVNTRFRLARAYSPRVFGDTAAGNAGPAVSISIGVVWPESPQLGQPAPITIESTAVRVENAEEVSDA